MFMSGWWKSAASIFDENGKNIPCTVSKLVHALLQVRTKGVDGYSVTTRVSMTAKAFHKAALGHF
jgi:hypothetical protein